MCRRLILLLVAALLSAAGAEGAGAVPSGGKLLMTGSKTASMTWSVRSKISIDTPSWPFAPPPGIVKRTGHMGGLVIRRGQEVIFGVVDDRDIGAPLLLGRENPVLVPGTYSVTLIADGPTSIDLALRGSPTIHRLRPVHPTRALRNSASALPNPHLPVVYASIPVAVPKSSVMVVAARIASTASQARVDDLCLLRRAEPCPTVMLPGSGWASSSESASVGSTGAGHSWSALFFYPGDVAPGRYYAGVDAATVGLVQSARLVVINIEL